MSYDNNEAISDTSYRQRPGRWHCMRCGRSDLTRIQQTSKSHGTARCYWCTENPLLISHRVPVEWKNDESEEQS